MDDVLTSRVRTVWDERDVCEVHPSPSAGTLCHSPCGPWARGSFLHYTSCIPLCMRNMAGKNLSLANQAQRNTYTHTHTHAQLRDSGMLRKEKMTLTWLSHYRTEIKTTHDGMLNSLSTLYQKLG